MADTTVTVFDVTLNGNELNDGTQDILTTDANTSYIIRSTYFSSTKVDNLTAKLNGIGTAIDFTAKATEGILIIPPSSTLSLESTNYPQAAEFFEASYFDNTNSNYVSKDTTYKLDGAAVTGTPAGVVAQSSAALANLDTTGNRQNFIMKVGDSYYQKIGDSNGDQKLYYWATVDAARTVLNDNAYEGSEFAEDGSGVYYFKNANNFYKHTPAAGEVLIRAGVPSANARSSYARTAICKGWYFWTNSSSDTAIIYAISTVTGSRCQLSSLGNMANYGGNTQIAVSYDETTDMFTIYRFDSGNYYWRKDTVTTANRTLTDLNAFAANTNSGISSFAKNSYGMNLISGGPNADASSKYSYDDFYSSPVIGSKTNGDEFYFITKNSPHQEIYKWNDVDQGISLAFTTSFPSSTATLKNYYFRSFTPTLAEQSSAALSGQATFQLVAHGIKEDNS